MEVHEKIKYGDIVYIEFYKHSKKNRMVLTSTGFELMHKSYVETKKITLSGDSIYLKDFEDNLFIIFPTMKNEYLIHKSILDEKIPPIRAKIELSNNYIDDLSIKNDINKLIMTFQETKKDVYSENEKFIKQFGTPIHFEENFILIHFKSHMFVTKHDVDSISNQNKNKLILTDFYSDDCIFLFSPYNNYDNKADFVFSNQNLFIRKKEKNVWANNQYLKIKVVTDEDSRNTIVQKSQINNNVSSININESTVGVGKNENYKYLLSFTEDQNNSNPFQIKICSNYIDPSSPNLSFANPVWISCQNIDKYLTITPTNKDEIIVEKNDDNKISNNPMNDNNNLRKTTQSFSNFRNLSLQNYQISFSSLDREKTMNNIYGLFNIEQLDNQNSYTLNDQYLKDQLIQNIELRMSPIIEYNKKIRLRHVATKKYLGFEEKSMIINKKTKYFGSLTLEEIPSDKCDWTLMESYKIINRNNFERIKYEGLKGPNNPYYHIGNKKNYSIDNSPKFHPVKKKEILRIFHIKSEKFLSFSEAKNNSEFEDKEILVNNLSVTRLPFDNDLVRLLPSNESQSWEIHLVLYFNQVLCKQIDNCIKIGLGKVLTNENQNTKLATIPENIVDTTSKKASFPNIEKEQSNLNLKEIKRDTTELRICFENLRDFCINKFSRKFDISVPSGKPVVYRQEFLFDQGFLDKSFVFLNEAKKFSSVYHQFLKLAEQSLNNSTDKGKKIQTKNTKDNITVPTNRPSKKNKPTPRNTRIQSIAEIFQEINLSIRKCFEFISACCKNHNKIKEFVFGFKNIFCDYLLEYKEAASCLMDLIKDNETFMNTLIKESIETNNNQIQEEKSENIIKTIITYLNNSDKYDINIIGLLSKLVKSGDKGITSNQEYIFNEIFEELQDKFLIKIVPQFNDTIFNVVYKNENKEFVKRELIELCSTKNSFTEYEKTIVRYLAEELNLFADLCFARNYVCIQKIRTIFPLDHLLFHIANLEIHEEILGGLINILNFVYIDIEPHSPVIYPTMIKLVSNGLKVERSTKIPMKTYIPFEKLNLILCLSLYLLNNIKYGKIFVNSANMNLIYNIIQFRLYENVEYRPMNIQEVINNQLDQALHNLKEDVKNLIISGEKILKSQMNSNQKKEEKLKIKTENNKDNTQSNFFDKIGTKFIDYNFEHNIGPEYLIYVLDYINEFFLERLIIDNIDANMENKNIIAQNFKSANKNDMLTQSNINYLMKIFIELKYILTLDKNGGIYGPNDLTDRRTVFLPIMKQIAKIINFILDIKKEDMINQILEKSLYEIKKVMIKVLSKLKLKKYPSDISLYDLCEIELTNTVDFKETMMDHEYYLYQLFTALDQDVNEYHQMLLNDEKEDDKNEKTYLLDILGNKKKNIKLYNLDINYENEFLNSIAFKNLQQLIIRILEVNVEEKMTKILVKLFTRIHSQKREIVECLKNIRILYDQQDLEKYYLCHSLIKKLALLTEKTEKWMTEDKIPLGYIDTKDSTKFKEAISTTKTNLLPDEDENTNDFENVINVLNQLIEMCYKNGTKVYKKSESLRLMQTIFFSFQLNDILFSLIREISQVYPNTDDENDKLNYFQGCLKILFKKVFKLFRCLVHNSKDFQNNITDTINFCQDYSYLKDLGFVNLFREMISKSESFTNQHLKFIMEIVKTRFVIENFVDVFDFFENDNLNEDRLIQDQVPQLINGSVLIEPRKNSIINKKKSISKEPEKISRRKYDKKIKNACQILSFVNSLISKVKDVKYLNYIIKSFEEIMKEFYLFSAPIKIQKVEKKNKGVKEVLNNEDKTITENPTFHTIQLNNKTLNYKMKLLYYQTKIGYKLLTINDKLKGLILRIFPLKNLFGYILKLSCPMGIDMLQKLVDYGSKNEREKIFKDNNILSHLKSFYKLKFNGFRLYQLVGMETLQKTNGLKSTIQEFFEILSNDLHQYFEIEKCLLNGYKKDHFVVLLLKKSIYKFFFIGFFPIIYQLTLIFKRRIYKTNEEYNKAISNIRHIMKNLKKIFNELKSEDNNNEYNSKVLNYISIHKQQFKDLFDKFELPQILYFSQNQPKVDNYYKLVFLKEYKTNQFPQNKKKLTLKLTVSFTEDFINKIENNKRIGKLVDKEIKILDKVLQSKINFHRIIQNYINENTASNIVDELLNDQENNYHLLNIFLKFIQENYLSTKYYPQINFLIEMFAYFIEVKPRILKSAKKQDSVVSNFFFKDRIDDLRNELMIHCQKLFLNNGSVEVFLKLVCEGNKEFNEKIFPSVLHFFNNVLEGGNNLSQKKFYQLFIFFPNCDNFFFFISKMFEYDIYQNLQNDISKKSPKKDFDNLNTIVALLKFLQLLTENHYTNLQEFMREQASNRLSYNFINILSDYMNMLLGKLGNIFETGQIMTKYTTELYYKRILAVLETLCKFLQGPCKTNQETLINSKIIEFFDKILRETELIPSDESLSHLQNIENIEEENEKIKENEKKKDNLNEDDNEEEENEDENFNKINEEKDLNQNEQKNFQQFKLFYLLSDYQKSLLIYKISVVCLSIIEGRKTKDNVMQKILRDFDYKLIYDKLNEIYLKIKDNLEFFIYNEEIEEFDESKNEKIVAESGFNLYFFIVTLADAEDEETEFKKLSYSLNSESHKLSKVEKENLIEITQNFESIKNAMEFYESHSLSIEMVKDNEILKAYCPKLAFFKNLSKEMLKTFQEEANRTSVQTKLMALLGEKDKLYETLKKLYELEEFFSKTGPFKFLFIYPNIIEFICLILGIIVNVFILIGYNVDKDEDQKDVLQNVQLFGSSKSTSKKILLALGITLTLFSSLIFTEFLTRKAPLIFRNIYVRYLKDTFETKIKKMNELEIHRIDKILTLNGIKNLLKKIGIYLRLISDPNVLYALAYILFSLLGLFVHDFFFAFHLMEFIKSQPILRSVLKAVYEPLEQLAYIFIFFLILVYFYSLIIYYSFYDIMPENSCESIVYCLAYVYSNTFTSGGNLGNFIDDEAGNVNKDASLTRYLLDISYTIIMVCLVFQMVTGLIIDTFSSLRNAGEEIENDIDNICFICGLNRGKIEKYYLGKEGFNKHLEDHDIASYFFYMFYLEEKQHSDYSGLESYVKAEIDKESISWFPIERCLRIEDWESKHKNLLN